MITDPVEDYARGFVPFLGTTIFLDSRPLIPRAETEFWVERASGMIYHARGPGPLRVLDLFSGSGCIGVAVLARVPGVTVDFADIESRHFPTIKKSLRENRIDPARARFIETDVWSRITDRYDLILANPPYLDEGSLLVEASVRTLEPREALYAGDHGFAIIDRTLTGAVPHLAPGGVIWIEHDPDQSTRIAALATELSLIAETEKDQYTVARVTKLTRQY